ncbi:MAG: integrin alpha, partial [Thermoplasmatales archaeon]|nr:integrin alpha [Thermoplasmatales archaeon]
MNDNFGFSVSSSDLNNDTAGDVIIGAPGYENNRGKVYVKFADGPRIVNDTETEFNTAESLTNLYVTSGGDVNLTILSPESTILTDDFSGASPPAIPPGWSTYTSTGTQFWVSSNTATAGGTAPEVVFDYVSTETGLYVLHSGNNDTTGYTSLKLTFKHMVDYFATPFTVGVKTRSGGVSWETANTVWSISPTANVVAETIEVTITNSDVGASDFQIGWFFEGNTYNIDYWYVDDIELIGLAVYESSGSLVSVNTTASFNIGSVKASWDATLNGQHLEVKVSRDGGTTWSFENMVNGETYRFTNNEPEGNILKFNVTFTALDTSKTPILHKITIYYSTGAEDISLTGEREGDKFGYSVACAGDVDNNSYDDLVVGAPYNNYTGDNAGVIYVYYGNQSICDSKDRVMYGEGGDDLFGFSVAGVGDLNNDGYDDIISGAYNYSSDQGKVYALTCRKATLTVSNWTKNETATVNVGTNDVLMLNMTLTASECTIRVTNIRVNLTNLTGTGVDEDVSACRLFHDANDNGTYEAGEDVFLGNETFSGGSLNFTLSFDVKYGTPEKLLLLFNITNSADAVGHYTGANLTDYSFISVARPDNVSNYNFPIQSTNMEITTAVTYDTLTVSGASKAPEFVNQGNTNITVLNLTLSSDDGGGGTITLTSINISLTGTGTSTNISGVTIYNDTDGSGGLSADDTQLNTTQVFTSSGYVLFDNPNFNVNYGCNAYIFVVYNISSTAIIDATVGANLTNETKITVDTSNGDTVAGFSTIWSYNSTIKDIITYEIRNETGVLQEGDWKVWGNWTANPNGTEVNGTNWLRIRNTNCSNNAQEVVVQFSQAVFTNTTKGWDISINGNIVFWYF